MGTGRPTGRPALEVFAITRPGSLPPAFRSSRATRGVVSRVGRDPVKQYGRPRVRSSSPLELMLPRGLEFSSPARGRPAASHPWYQLPGSDEVAHFYIWSPTIPVPRSRPGPTLDETPQKQPTLTDMKTSVRVSSFYSRTGTSTTVTTSARPRRVGDHTSLSAKPTRHGSRVI
jgi:hypothetical protein